MTEYLVENFNLTGCIHCNSTFNGTLNGTASSPGGATPIALTSAVRIVTLAIFLIFALVGNVSVFAWMHRNRREKNRIHLYIFHLATADLLVSLGPLLSQIILSCIHDAWLLDDISCRFFSFALSFTLMASSNIVAVIAIDRHHCVLYPFAKKPNPNSLILAAWLIAAGLSLPQLYVWGILQVYDGGPYYCLSTILMSRPDWHMKIYLTYISLVVFFIPFCLLSVLYLRVSWRVAHGGKGVITGRNNRRKKAKLRTMKMTIVLVLVFILTGLPYFIVELQRMISGGYDINPILDSILGIFAVSACAFNPYVFLVFNVKKASKDTVSTANPRQTYLATHSRDVIGLSERGSSS